MCDDIWPLRFFLKNIIVYISAFFIDAVGYNAHVVYSEALYPYRTLGGDEKLCKSECDQDIYCNGYSTDSSNNSCFLSRCNSFIKVPGCSTCFFSSKKGPLSSVLCSPDTTTIDLTTKMTVTISPVTTATDKVTHTINNTFCTCVCKFVNQTLHESIDNRRKDLILNKTKLTSTVRKLSSAQDFRMSSEVIGVVAIIVLVMIGVVCFCVDVGYLMSLVLSINSIKHQI